MLRSIFQKLNSSLGGGAVLIAFFSVISKVIGFLRDRLLASLFGASRVTDIYFASFKIPDLLFNIFVLGAVTSAFIPIFQKAWRRSEKEALDLSNSLLNMLLIIMGIMATLLYLLAPELMRFVVPGFDQPALEWTIRLTRILLVSLIFFTISNVLSGVLNAWNKFFTFALSSVVYNIGIIVGILFLYPLFGLYGLGFGVILGALLHMGVQLVEALRQGWVYRPIIRFSDDTLRVFYLMLPRTIGLAGNQIALVIVTLLASLLPGGHIAVFNYANNLQSFPVSVFGISLAVAAFPSFSLAASRQDMHEFKRIFARQAIRILYFLMPISFAVILLRAHIVRVVLGTGSFDWDATILTANALGLFALSLPAQGLIPLLSRSYFALEDTRTPVLISLLGLGFTIALSIALLPNSGVLGLALAHSIGSLFTLTALYGALRGRLNGLNDKQLLAATSRITILTAIAGSLMYLSLRVAAPLLDLRSFVGIFMHGSIAAGLGAGSYVLMGSLLHIEEVALIRRYIRKFLSPLTILFKR